MRTLDTGSRFALVLSAALLATMAPAGLAQLATPAAEADALDWRPAVSPTAGPAHDVDGSGDALVVSTWNEGTLRSTDGGDTWRRVDDAGVTALDVLADPTDAARLYLAGNGGVARSTDAGASFQPVLDGHLTRVAAVSAEGTLAAHLQPTDGADDRLLLSHDGGDTWTRIGTPYEGQAALEGLAFGPTDEQLVLADQGTTWVSDDGGQTWTTQDTGARELAAEDGSVWRYGSGGLERSTDGGHAWTTLELEPAASALAPHPEGGLYAATQDGVLLTTDGGETWTDMGAAPLAWQATGMVADPTDPDAVLFSDETIGVNWVGPSEDGDGFAYEGRSAGFTPTPIWTVDASPHGDLTLAGGAQGLWASPADEEGWTHTGAGIGMTGVEAAAAGPAGEPVYAGGSDWNLLPYVQVGSLDGSTWATTTLEAANDGKVVDLETHPADGSTAWAAVRLEFAPSKVYETTDGGHTWTPILQLGANPPLVTHGEALHAIGYDEATDELLAATDLGVLAHEGHGVWTPRSGSPEPVDALATRAGHVYAGGPAEDVWASPHPDTPLLPWAATDAGLAELDAASHGQHAWALDDDGRVHVCTPTEGTVPEGACRSTGPASPAVSIAHAPASGTLWAGTLADGLYRASTR